MPTNVTVAVVARDEARCLGRCLDSLSHAGFERVLVLDTGSTDGTQEIAAERPWVRLESGPWKGSFAQARNAALAMARTDLVLFVDADEWVSSDPADFWREVAASPLTGGEVAAPAILSGDLSSTETPRLLHRHHQHYVGRVHEYVEGRDGSRLHIRPTALTLSHDGYQPEVVASKNKALRNTELLTQQITEDPNNPRWRCFLVRDAELEIDDLAALCHELLSCELVRPGDQYEARFYWISGIVAAIYRAAISSAPPHVMRDLQKMFVESGPTPADEFYIRCAVELSAGGVTPRRALLSEGIAIRGALDGQSHFASDGRHVDAVLAHLLYQLDGPGVANDFLKLCDPWTDAFYSASVPSSQQ